MNRTKTNNRSARLPFVMVLSLMAVLLVSVGAVPAQQGGGGGRHQRQDRAPHQGATAPDFTLTVLNSEEILTLSELVKEKPVALLFGSWT